MISHWQAKEILARIGELGANVTDVSSLRSYVQTLEDYKHSAETQFHRLNRIVTLLGKTVDDYLDKRSELSADPELRDEYLAMKAQAELSVQLLEILGIEETF